MSLLPEIDPLFKIKESYSYDHDSGDVVIRREQHIQAILDNNKEMANANDQAWKKKPDKWMLFATIPVVVIEQWMQAGIDIYRAKYDRRTGAPNWHMRQVLKKLEDPDFRYLKATSMRMG